MQRCAERRGAVRKDERPCNERWDGPRSHGDRRWTRVDPAPVGVARVARLALGGLDIGGRYEGRKRDAHFVRHQLAEPSGC